MIITAAIIDINEVHTSFMNLKRHKTKRDKQKTTCPRQGKTIEYNANSTLIHVRENKIHPQKIHLLLLLNFNSKKHKTKKINRDRSKIFNRKVQFPKLNDTIKPKLKKLEHHRLTSEYYCNQTHNHTEGIQGNSQLQNQQK